MMQRLIQFSVLASFAFSLVGIGSIAAGAETAAAAPVKIEQFRLKDFRGKKVSLADYQSKDVVVVVFLGAECPLVKLYAKRLQELHKKYSSKGVAILGVNSNQQDSLAEIAHFVRTNKLKFPMLKDPGNKIADRFDAERTPEVFVLDSQRHVRYRGRIDDQFTYGIQRPTIEKDYLANAIDSLLAGEPVAIEKTETVGCHIGRVLKPVANAEVTWSNQISRIMQKRCVECHREGEIGPFVLTDYEEAVGWAEMIDEVVREQRMPPWHADAEHGNFSNDVRLTEEEKALIYKWVADGAPKGDPADLPEPREFTVGWRIGKPDVIINMASKPFQVPPAGEVKYQYFWVDPGFTEDKWIKAAECRPGNRQVVHHIIVAVQPPLVSRAKHADIGSKWLTATAPGAAPLVLEPGMAKFIPAGSKLFFQLHYTPNGEPQEDLSSVGLIFADPEEVRHVVATKQAAKRTFFIPPGDDNFKVEASYKFNEDSLMLSMFPHMHLRGKSFKYTANYPDGTTETLLNVPHYDFNWQNGYKFAEPKTMPKGTVLKCVAHFDNSAENLANPDPTQTVTWGDQTWEEMMIGYFNVTPVREVRITRGVSSNRTKRFLKTAKEQPPQISDELRELAENALNSSDGFSAFAKALQSQVPQIDRVDYITIDGGKLSVEMAMQRSNFRRLVGGPGISTRSQGTALAKIAAGDDAVAHGELSSRKEPDLVFMHRAFAAGFHVPFEVGGRQRLINFWSAEKVAFPAEVRPFLTDVVDLVK